MVNYSTILKRSAKFIGLMFLSIGNFVVGRNNQSAIFFLTVPATDLLARILSWKKANTGIYVCSCRGIGCIWSPWPRS